MRRCQVRLAVILLSLAVSPVLAEGEETTTIRVLHPVGMGFTVQTDSNGSVLRTWSTLNGGEVLMFARDTEDTLGWTVQTSSGAGADVLQIHAGQSGVIGAKTCCTFQCDQSYHFSIHDQDCHPFGGGCQYCVEECSDGWDNCPAGTTELDRR